MLSESKASILITGEDVQVEEPICLFKKPLTAMNCHSSSESVTSSRGNQRYSRCGAEDDYGDEQLLSEEIKETNNTRLTYNRGGTCSKAQLGNQ
jgi:hypothetical protein